MEEESITWDEALKKARAIVVHGARIIQSFDEERSKGADPENEDRQLV